MISWLTPLLLLFAGPTPAGDLSAAPAWTHDGYNPARVGGEGSIPARPTLAWKFKSPGGFHAPPAIFGNLVIAGDDEGRLSCLEAEDGRVVWDRRFSGYLPASAVGEGGRAYIVVSRREVISEPVSGGIFSSGPSARQVNEDRGEVTCLDISRGQKVWERHFSHLIHSTPAVAPGGVVFGCHDYKVYCLDQLTGKNRWVRKTIGPVTTAVVVDDERVIAAAEPDRLYCLSLSDGGVLWEFKAAGKVVAAPAYFAGRAFAGSASGTLHCLALESGLQLWEFKAPAAIELEPVVYDRKVYVASGKMLTCLAGKDGAVRWSYDNRRAIYSTPVISENRVVLCSAGGELICLDAGSGERVWEYPLPRDQRARLSVFGGRVFAATPDRYLYCLREKEGARNP